MDREITLNGVVSAFQFVNPHPFVTITVESQNGSRQQWRGELDNRSELVGIGMTSGTFKAGDRVAANNVVNPALHHPELVRQLQLKIRFLR